MKKSDLKFLGSVIAGAVVFFLALPWVIVGLERYLQFVASVARH